MQPFTIGCVIAYLFGFILKFYENILNKASFYANKPLKAKRTISIILTYISAGIGLFLLIIVIAPQVSESLVTLVNDSPVYLTNLAAFIEKNITDLNLDPQVILFVQDSFSDLASTVISFFTSLIPLAGNLFISVISSIWNICLGIIISIYLLTDKERFKLGIKKVTMAILPSTASNKLFYIIRKAHNIFSKFLIGKIIDSLIVGVLTFIVLQITKIPYATLISVIIGITNLIPFFGPFIGAIPSTLLLLVISPSKAILFVVIIIIIQQIDGNIIGPKILGDSLGISAFWILFSLLVAGKLLGLVGMIIGVPLFATIYTLITEVVEARLENKNIELN